MPKHSIPGPILAPIVASIESARGVTLAPMKDARRANP
jgi:hypothetical protein